MARLLFDSLPDWMTVVQPPIRRSSEAPPTTLALHQVQACDCCACAGPGPAVAASAAAHAIIRIVTDIRAPVRRSRRSYRPAPNQNLQETPDALCPSPLFRRWHRIGSDERFD